MELLLVVIGIVVLVAFYFCLGVVVKFFLAWWIVFFGVPILVAVGIALGWVGAVFAVAGFVVLLSANNRWHDSELYLDIERRVDSIFYLSDT